MSSSDDQASSPSRRKFLIGGAAAIGVGGTAAALHFKPWYRPLGSNSDIRLGIAGLGGKGRDHCNHFQEIPGARITALCDPDPNQLERCFKETDLKRDGVQVFSDFRKMIESDEFDALVIASPNHWHAVMGVWAMRAGKHVYVEKPIAHTIWEGEQLVKVAAETGMVAQSGTQRRSDQAYYEAAAWLAEGQIGKIESLHAVVFRQRKRVTRRKSPTPMSEGIDYDHWCGPAPVEELYRAKLHYDWHWHWNTGNGELGNNGIHFLDVARILMGASDLPGSAISAGGRFGWGDDAGQSPNAHVVYFDYEVPLLAEIRNLPMAKDGPAMDNLSGIREGIVAKCEGGTLAWPKAKNNDGKTVKKFDSQDGHGHRINWLRAIVDQKPADVNAPLREGHISSALCHLGNRSHRTGAALGKEEIQAQYSDNAAAKAALERLSAHLEKNEIDLANEPLLLGKAIGKSDASEKPKMRVPYELT